jgi:hypothetical protein
VVPPRTPAFRGRHMGPATVPVSDSRPPKERQDGHRWPLRTSPAVYLQQNSGQSQRIGTRAAFIHRKNDDNATIRRWPSHHA